jgi:precorrin-2 methylase
MKTLFNSKEQSRTARARKVGEQMAEARAQPKIIVTDGKGREIAATVAEFGAVAGMAAVNYFPRVVSALEADRASYRRFLAKRGSSNGEPVKAKKKRASRKKVIDAAN